jgi:hypothetical protein
MLLIIYDRQYDDHQYLNGHRVCVWTHRDGRYGDHGDHACDDLLKSHVHHGEYHVSDAFVFLHIVSLHQVLHANPYDYHDYDHLLYE